MDQLRLSLLFLLLCLLSPTVSWARDPMCSCNHGVVVAEAPQCKCVCFGKYLLPHCLYTPNEMVEMELWLLSRLGGGVNETLPLSAADITTGLSWAFSRDPGDGTFGLVRANVATSVAGQKQGGQAWTQSTVVATVIMPGWAAQHLLADVMKNNVGGYIMRNSLSGVPYDIIAAFDDAMGPPLAMQYSDESFAFYGAVHGTWFVATQNLAWFFFGGLVVMLVYGIESRYTYNMWWNTSAVQVRPVLKSERNLKKKKKRIINDDTNNTRTQSRDRNGKEGTSGGLESPSKRIERSGGRQTFLCSESEVDKMQLQYVRNVAKTLRATSARDDAYKISLEDNPLMSSGTVACSVAPKENGSSVCDEKNCSK